MPDITIDDMSRYLAGEVCDLEAQQVFFDNLSSMTDAELQLLFDDMVREQIQENSSTLQERVSFS